MYKATVDNTLRREHAAAINSSAPSSVERYYAEHLTINKELEDLRLRKREVLDKIVNLKNLIARAKENMSRHRVVSVPLGKWKSDKTHLDNLARDIDAQIIKVKEQRKRLEAERAMEFAGVGRYLIAVYFMKVAKSNLPAEVFDRLEMAAVGMYQINAEMSGDG